MANPCLLLWLEAPLQSWGCESRFNRRETLKFPTRSGILGLILCAMGAGGPQTEWLEKMSRYGQTVLSFRREKGTRESQSRLTLCDFHMVGSGYDDSDPWQTLMIPKTLEGKKAVGGGTKMTFRYFLQDAAFAVIAEIPEEFSEVVDGAFQNPCWDLYLGRKCCVPTDLVYRGLFASENLAKKSALEIAKSKGLAWEFSVIEGKHEDLGDVLSLSDVPVQFGMYKKYADRQVTVIYDRNNG